MRQSGDRQGFWAGGFSAEVTNGLGGQLGCMVPSEEEEAADSVPEFLRAVEGNMNVEGTLTLHFHERDIDLDVDGYAALKTIANVANGSGTWGDLLNPAFSDASLGWFAVRGEYLLAASWAPRSTCLCQ